MGKNWVRFDILSVRSLCYVICGTCSKVNLNSLSDSFSNRATYTLLNFLFLIIGCKFCTYFNYDVKFISRYEYAMKVLQNFNNRNTFYNSPLTPWSRVLFEKLIGPQLFKKFSIFHGTRRFITTYSRAHHLSVHFIHPQIYHVVGMLVSDTAVMKQLRISERRHIFWVQL